MSDFLFRPRRIPRTGDDSPAGSLFRYLWRMSGRHQLWICLLAIVVAALTAVPLELQRRIVDEVIKDRETALLWTLGGGYRSEEHTSELQSLMRNSYAVLFLKK